MEKQKKRMGGPADARWSGAGRPARASPHLMDKRTDAEVYVNMEFDVTEVLRYIEEKNRGEEEYKATLFHCTSWPLPKRSICGRI